MMVAETRIEKTHGICGGNARVARTRIPVWLLVLNRRWGKSDVEVLASYPVLMQDDLDAAWDYFRHSPLEIEREIWLNDVAGNVPPGTPVPAAAIVAGLLLGLDDDAIAEAFDPPLTSDELTAAWTEYRADPIGVGQSAATSRRAG